MPLFDNVFYVVYRFYVSKQDLIPRLTAAIITTLIQVSNLMSVVFLISIFSHYNISLNKLLLLFFYAIGLGFNYWYYKKEKIKKLSEEWENMERRRKFRNEILILCYLAFSLFFCVGLAILNYKTFK